MTSDKLIYYYRAADVFCLPTREDIWGLVVNEAMVNGLPVVTSNYCGAGLELVRNGFNGYLVEKLDAEHLKEAICKTLLCEEKMGEESRNIIKDYTIDNMALRHIELLNQSNT